jgi:thioredoxin
MAALQDVTGPTFAQDVLEAPGTVVVDFWAPWCGPCVALTPHLERIAARLPAELRVVKLDVDSEPETASQLRVRGLPVLIAFRGGREVARIQGAKSPRDVERWLQGLAAASDEVEAAARAE